MEGSNSNFIPRNKGYDRPNSRNYSSNYYNAQYNMDNNDDYLLFIWFASLKRFEDYIYLFIIVWNSLKFEIDRNVERSVEFSEEISQMNNYIEELFTNNVINKQELNKFSSLLDEFRNHSYNDPDAKKELVKGVLNKLEKYEISRYKYQLYNLKHFQKKHIRQMILSRMESFVDITSQTHVVDEEKTDLSLDNPIELRKEIESLRRQISNLAQENSHYQATLGNMTNTRLSDQDPNNATKLISDIKDLQHLLEDFTIVQGPEYIINERRSMELFTKKKCQVDFSKPNAKLILGGILQQYIIKQILEDVDSYFKDTKNRNLDEALEVEILNTTENLIQFFNHLDENRPGNPGNDIAQAVPTKIRQQVYAALGSRGFSNDNHPLIVGTAKKICDLMDKYREINDQDILSEIDSQSIQIARKVISIFYFRLKTQQIIPTYRFFESGEEIDTRLMQGTWKSEEIKKLEVEVCYFPCVMISNSNSSEQKIFTKAQIYTRPKNTIAATTGNSVRGITAAGKTKLRSLLGNK